MRALILLLGAALAGCATPEPVIVKVPVVVGCLGELPVRPVPRFGAGQYPGSKEAAQAALLDSLAFQAYSTGLEVTIAGCEPKPAGNKTPK